MYMHYYTCNKIPGGMHVRTCTPACSEATLPINTDNAPMRGSVFGIVQNTPNVDATARLT